MLDKDYYEPSANLFKELNWLPFSERIANKKAILVYKALNNMCPHYFNSKFVPLKSTSVRTLRSTSNDELVVPKPRLEFYRKTLSYSGPTI